MLKKIILAVAAATVLMPGTAFAEMTFEERLAPGQPPAVISYRARGGGAPDNSLAGIQYAIDRGIDIVEVQVQPTRDGQYVLMLDNKLTDGTNVTDVYPDGAPSLAGSALARRHLTNDYTLEEIAQLRLKDPNRGDHPVPNLDTVLELAEGRLLVVLSLMRWDIETLVPLLQRHDAESILLLSRRDHGKLNATAEAAGVGVATYPNVADVERRLDKDLGTFGSRLRMIYVTSAQLSPELLAKSEEQGVAIAIHGAAYADEDDALLKGNSDRWRSAFDSGAAAFGTRRPDAVLKLLDR